MRALSEFHRNASRHHAVPSQTWNSQLGTCNRYFKHHAAESNLELATDTSATRHQPPSCCRVKLATCNRYFNQPWHQPPSCCHAVESNLELATDTLTMRHQPPSCCHAAESNLELATGYFFSVHVILLSQTWNYRYYKRHAAD